MKTLLTTERIPANVPPKCRARLMRLQMEKVKRQMRNHWFFFEPQTMSVVKPFSMKLEECALGEEFVKLMNKTEMKWVITPFIISRQRNGKQEITIEPFAIKTPCKHAEISYFVADYTMQMIDEFRQSRKSKDFVTAGWVANMCNEATINDIDKLCEIVGAWKLPSDREDELENEC